MVLRRLLVDTRCLPNQSMGVPLKRLWLTYFHSIFISMQGNVMTWPVYQCASTIKSSWTMNRSTSQERLVKNRKGREVDFPSFVMVTLSLICTSLATSTIPYHAQVIIDRNGEGVSALIGLCLYRSSVVSQHIICGEFSDAPQYMITVHPCIALE